MKFGDDLLALTCYLFLSCFAGWTRFRCVRGALREKCPNKEFFLDRIFLYSFFFRIQSEYRKIWTRKNSVFGHFSRSEADRVLWREAFQALTFSCHIPRTVLMLVLILVISHLEMHVLNFCFNTASLHLLHL